MSRRKLLPPILFLALLAVPPTSRAQAFPLNELMAQLARLPARQADFTEQKQLAALSTPLVSHGRLLFRRPGHLEKITTAPRPERLVVDGETLTLAEPGQPVQTIALDQRTELQAMVDAIRGPLSGNLAMLRRHFAVRAEGSLQDWRLTLWPSDPPVQSVLERVTIAGAGTDIRAIDIDQSNGDRLAMTVTGTS